MLMRRTALASSRYRGIPRLYMVHAFVHTVRSNGGAQGLRHVIYHSRLDTRPCVQNATIHYACLTSSDTMGRHSRDICSSNAIFKSKLSSPVSLLRE